jgi:hypothetical protein
LLDDGFRRIAGQPQQTVVASAAPLPPDPGAQNPAAAAQPEAAAMEIAATDKGGHEVKEGEIDGVKLSEAVGASAPPAAASQIAVNEADLSLGESSTEGEGDISEAPAPEPGHPLSHLHKIVLHAPQKQPGTGSWSVQIGTFSNKASSDAELKKAALRLPGGVKEKAAAASVPLSYRRKHVFRAEFTGLSELEAKKACSVLSHCLTIKPAA